MSKLRELLLTAEEMLSTKTMNRNVKKMKKKTRRNSDELKQAKERIAERERALSK